MTSPTHGAAERMPGVFLVTTGVRFLRAEEEAPSLEQNRLVRLALDFAHAQIDHLVSRRMGRHCLARAG